MAGMWNTEELAVFQRLTDDGLTCTQIARDASAVMNRTITRNMVIGLWNRARVTRGDAQKERASHRDDRDRGAQRERRLQAKAEKREAKKAARRSFVPLIAVENPPPTIDDLMIPAEQRRTLMQLSFQTCKWPVGEPGQPDFFFCGAEPTRGSSYCAGHHFRSTNYAAPEPFRRKVNFLAEAAE